MRIKEQD